MMFDGSSQYGSKKDPINNHRMHACRIILSQRGDGDGNDIDCYIWSNTKLKSLFSKTDQAEIEHLQLISIGKPKNPVMPACYGFPGFFF